MNLRQRKYLMVYRLTCVGFLIYNIHVPDSFLSALKFGLPDAFDQILVAAIVGFVLFLIGKFVKRIYVGQHDGRNGFPYMHLFTISNKMN
jgi:uncharacterized YccA/Bax inhibitor family protein